MKRSEINALMASATEFWQAHGWHLPPNPRWDVTDFGLGDWRRYGLVLVNLAEEPEYCEKLMYARRGMTTPEHMHRMKKEDIVCRFGELGILLWPGLPSETTGQRFEIKVNGVSQDWVGGERLVLRSGERVTLPQGMYHEFAPLSEECVIGEVSTANDDLHDNFWTNENVGRFTSIVEDEPPLYRLIGDSDSSAANC